MRWCYRLSLSFAQPAPPFRVAFRDCATIEGVGLVVVPYGPRLRFGPTTLVTVFGRVWSRWGLHPLKRGGVPEQSEGEGVGESAALIDTMLLRRLHKPCCFANPLRSRLFGETTFPVPLRYTREDPRCFICDVGRRYSVWCTPTVPAALNPSQKGAFVASSPTTSCTKLRQNTLPGSRYLSTGVGNLLQHTAHSDLLQ